ncbi:MAG TPA: macro domain-containing protein [Myxococcales bacterium]|jgi:O-acetyl-ADP-ribose deacetylase (regulator of RNase III)
MNAPRPTLSEPDLAAAVEELCRLLDVAPARSPDSARQRLRERLTVLAPGTLPAKAWPLLEAVWSTEGSRRPATRAAGLPRLAASGWASRVSLWRGDITTLEVGAIVNAANSGLTGCYRPLHACVDNAIHAAAGPWLREECGQIMEERGRPEPTATATTTAGYFLPARHVVHTVGPIVETGAPTPEHESALRRCYRECLKAGAALPAGARSLAFCGISQGVFGYPVPLAAAAATSAVREFLGEDASLDQVVLVTFSASDHAAYQVALQEALRA